MLQPQHKILNTFFPYFTNSLVLNLFLQHFVHGNCFATILSFVHNILFFFYTFF